MSAERINYFDPEYRASRKRVGQELREFAETQPPSPEPDWGVIWPLVGPELTFEEQAPTVTEEAKKTVAYNQTKQRFETAINLARQVTALRLGKPFVEVTIADISQAGPTVYWNGRVEHNENLAKIVASGDLEKKYHFPVSKILITTSQRITNTKDQFEDFPDSILPAQEKLVVVTDLYHLPRSKRYLQKYPNKFPPDRMVLYPSQPVSLPPKMALRELKNIFPYSKKGDLPPE